MKEREREGEGMCESVFERERESIIVTDETTA